jgi:hypothetical protein
MRRLVVTVLFVLGLAACTEDSGYVEIKVAPGFAVPPLMLGSTRVDVGKRGSAILRQRAGPTTLAFEREGRMIPFCQFDVRRNRILTVAITALGRDPRCKLQA